MIYIGIDPGFSARRASIGLAVLRETAPGTLLLLPEMYCTLRPIGATLETRLASVKYELDKWAYRVKAVCRSSEVVIATPRAFVAHNVRTTIELSEAAAWLAAFACQGVSPIKSRWQRVDEVASKQQLAGAPNATKEMMIAAVQQQFKIKVVADVADAIGHALAGRAACLHERLAATLTTR